MCKNDILKISASAVSAFLLCAGAEDGTWNWFTEGYTNGLSVEAAADWNDPANWVDGAVPANATDSVAYLVPKDRTSSMSAFPARWIKIPDSGVTVGGINTRMYAEMYLIGGPITFGTSAPSFNYNNYGLLRDEVASSPACRTWIFAPITFPVQINRGILCNRANICAPVTCPPDGRIQISADYRHYMNRYATSTSEQIVDEGLTGCYSLGSGNLRIFARMSAPEQTGVWSTVAGSPYLRRIGSVHDLAPGCSVTGTGIPEGAFLKRIFSDGLVEISEAATATSEDSGVSLVFGAFNPSTVQHVNALNCQGTDYTIINFYFTKFRADDEFRIVVTNINGGAVNNVFVINTAEESASSFAVEKTFYPGTLVLNNTSNFKTQLLLLENAHIEFSPTNGTRYAGINRILVNQEARITVPDDVTATLHNLQALNGTLTKDGTGVLAANTTNATHAAIVVEEGEFIFNPKYSKDTPKLTTLTVAGSATFRLAAGKTLSLENNPSLASGATVMIEEGARLLVPMGYVLPSGVSFTGDGTLVRKCVADGLDYGPIRATPAAGTVVGNPAFWVTAESLTNAVPAGTLVAENGTNFVTRWNDCRGEAEDGYRFCTNVFHRPRLVTNEGVPYVFMPINGKSNGAESMYNHGLAWDIPLENIRNVFVVLQNPAAGTGCLLGATRRLTRSDYLRGSCSATANLFYRNTGNCSSPNVYQAPIYLNGMEKVYNNTYSGCSDTTIVEVDTLDDTSADAFAICNSGQFKNRWDLCGGRFVECIIYTNALTYAERLQVSDYLMRKWRKTFSPHYYADPRQRIDNVEFPSGGAAFSFEVPSGNAVTAVSFSPGGSLVKAGEGVLHIMDYSDSTGTIKVEKGSVTVQSADPSTYSLPAGAYLHLDASAENTLTFKADGASKRITEWKDPVGGLTATLCKTSTTNAPLFVENALNGLPVLDFGAPAYNSGDRNNPTLQFPMSRNLHTIFSVIGSAKGGNTILGGTSGRNDGLSKRITDNASLGIWRDVQSEKNWGNYSLPLVTTSSSSQMGNIGNVSKTEFRKNGIVVNQNTEPMSGGYDLYSVKTLTAHNLESDIIGGIHYGNAWGGVEFAELAYYESVLMQDQVSDAETYLMNKWFNRGAPKRRPAVVGTLSVAADATFGIWGTAPVTASAVSGAGTVDASLKMTDGASVTAEVASDGSVSCLTVTGEFEIPSSGTVNLAGNVSALVAGTYPVVSADSIKGEASDWNCVCAFERYIYTVHVSGNALMVSVLPPSTVIILR